MKKERQLVLVLICLLAMLVNSPLAIAQEKKVAPGEPKLPTAGTFKFLGSAYALGKVVKGAPYSATATTEHKQTLADGNQIMQKNEAKIYRDGEGRVRLEQKLETLGKWSADGEPLQLIYINDPVSGQAYNLDPRTRSAHRSNAPIPAFKEKRGPAKPGEAKMPAPAQPLTHKMKLQEPKNAENPPAQAGDLEPKLKQGVVPRKVPPQGVGVDDGRVKTELLGRELIEGVEAEGKRLTTTIPAGEIGNTLPIEIVDESWYSPELQTPIMTRRYDPRTGETVYRLTNIIRGEPDRSLFEVPPDYTLQESPLPSPLPAKKKLPEEGAKKL